MIVCYTKYGAGARTGRDWANAKPVSALAEDVGGAGAGDQIRIGFPRRGEAPIFWAGRQALLEAFGGRDAPTAIQAGFIGVGAELVPAGSQGPIFYRNANAPHDGMPELQGRAPFGAIGDNILFSGFHLEGATADGFVKLAKLCRGVHICGISARTCGRVVETDRSAVLDDSLIEDCDASGLVRGFARFRLLSNSRLRNLTLDANNLDGGGDNVCQIIAVSAGRAVTFENVSVRRAFNPRPGYAQGDGIVCEKDTSDFVFRNCHASEMGDGGFDLKTVNVTMEDCTARDCKRGARIWANGVLRRCSFSAPRRVGQVSGACMETKGRAELHDCRLQAGAGAAVFHLAARGGGVGSVRMYGGAITLDSGAALISGDPGGVLELEDVNVNGALRRERIVSLGGMAR